MLMMAMVMAAAGCLDRGDSSSPVKRAVIEVDAATATQLHAPEQSPLCALADALPADDICSMICDPDAMKDMLLAEGSPSGRCYELACTLDATTTVQVGVCLPPPT
jgi:hypothetical protein